VPLCSRLSLVGGDNGSGFSVSRFTCCDELFPISVLSTMGFYKIDYKMRLLWNITETAHQHRSVPLISA
jgi:hypothetical protein